ncbi:MAG TPA: hypothetical protein PKY29_02985 [Ferruginibacter sp.]|nr:hypothetical protein [Ferruginibacter sp.]HRO17498.1 hypothetical protein [Ferruginibacter sp.]HRQ20249.1 hypothetical protein [Ferruginibacter sp.]
MKAATLKTIKDELGMLGAEELQQMLLRLARFKVENKELLTYLLFESSDEAQYVQEVMQEMDVLFGELNTGSGYIIKKQLRKIIRLMLKHIRYSGETETEVRLRLHFCKNMYAKGLHQSRSTQIRNMFESQRTYAGNTIQKMHEDLQYEYVRELDRL